MPTFHIFNENASKIGEQDVDDETLRPFLLQGHTFKFVETAEEVRAHREAARAEREARRAEREAAREEARADTPAEPVVDVMVEQPDPNKPA